ncbi:MAG: hypothetical protein A2X94_06485 [Bdellovibrionales bacterium GWB1_55_8]|nr:MAG: hypothetical protein A2X94_06485 [Bdellovibrionales bacterium GWB1_55_8]
MNRFISAVLFASFLIGTGAIAQAAETYNCHGTEPFWSIEFDQTSGTYADPMNESVAVKVDNKREAAGFSAGVATVFDIYANGKKAVVAVTMNSCNNGMSDEEFDYQVVIIGNDDVLMGCCRVTK